MDYPTPLRNLQPGPRQDGPSIIVYVGFFPCEKPQHHGWSVSLHSVSGASVVLVRTGPRGWFLLPGEVHWNQLVVPCRACTFP